MTASENSGPAFDFATFAATWRVDGILRLLNYVWAGYDALQAENPATLKRDDEINVNSHLESWIRRKMPKNCPFDIQHTPPEVMSRLRQSGAAPTPDFGFFPWTDRRAMFPLEAKVMKTPGDLGPYLEALRTRFLQCRYAPNSSEGVMICYLLTGDLTIIFKKLTARLKTDVVPHPGFPTKPHRVSLHTRKHRRCKNSPKDFRCHHLVMALS